jgi:Ran GTPase-activating protein (RanGAP) involved in mRNA processing and transport
MSKEATNMQRLEAKLESMRTSTVVNLSDCYIGDEGCQILARFLTKYSSVTDLELKGNNIGGSGISALATAIRQTYTIKTISLEWNNLGSSETGL